MFRLHEIERTDEIEIATRVLAQTHAVLDTKFPHTKANVSDAFKETAFSMVEDTISDGEPANSATPGVPATRDSTPITSTSARIDTKEKKDEPLFSRFNEELNEHTHFSLDEPRELTREGQALGKKQRSKKVWRILLALLILLAMATLAFYFAKKHF